MKGRGNQPGRGARGPVLGSRRVRSSMPEAADIRRSFERGRYAEVIARSVDTPVFDADGEPDVGYVVAALAAAGRLDDAAALLARVPADADARQRALARFFLAVARCRAGQFVAAQQLFLENVQALRARRRDAELRFYALQGLCCLRYFSGRMRAAERLSRAALQAAFAASSALGRMLATDIQGHACVQMGQVKRGLSLLKRAHDLATAFGFDAHRAAIELASTSYEARFGVQGLREMLVRLSAAESARVDDSYSLRLLLLDRALLSAFAGRADEARALLAAVDAQLIPEGDRRMQVRTLLTAALVAALRDGEQPARQLVAAAEARLHDAWDRALRVELLCTRAFCASAGERRALASALAEAARVTGIARASLFSHLLEPSRPVPESVSLRDFEDDRLGALLMAALHDNQLPRLLREHYYGLVPRALGLAPGRRVYLIEPGHLLVENHGNVSFERPGETSVRLLRVLADGRWWSKEALLAAVWGIASYRPDRHDSVVYMAVTRTRQALGACRDWLENEHGAYRLSAAECRSLPWRDEVHGFDVRSSLAVVSGTSDPTPPQPSAAPQDGSAALSFVREHGHATTGGLAKALRVSDMTALRELQKLVASGVLRRVGKGRATRYEINEDTGA